MRVADHPRAGSSSRPCPDIFRSPRAPMLRGRDFASFRCCHDLMSPDVMRNAVFAEPQANNRIRSAPSTTPPAREHAGTVLALRGSRISLVVGLTP